MMKRTLALGLAVAFALTAGTVLAAGKPFDVGQPAPDFEVKNFSTGNQFKLSDVVKDNKTGMVFTYFSSSCNSCRAEIAALKAASESGTFDAGKVNVYLVSVDFNEAAIPTYLKTAGLESWKVLYDPQFKSAKALGVRATPATIIVDKKGVIAYRHLGFAPEEIDGLVSEIKKVY